MKNKENSFMKQNSKSTKLVGLFGFTLLLAAAGCGNDDNETAGDKAKAATDAVENKAEDVKDAVTPKEETRAEVDARLNQEVADLNAKISELETKWNEDTVPAIQAANKARLVSLKSSLAEANTQLEAFRASAEAEWKVKRDTAVASLTTTKAKVASALDRQKLKEEVNVKLIKIQNKIENLKTESANASAEAKQKLEDSRTKLEAKSAELQASYARFQESAEEKWDDFKEGFKKSFDELAAAFQGLFD